MSGNDVLNIYGTKYSRVDQVKFVEDSLWKFGGIWSACRALKNIEAPTTELLSNTWIAKKWLTTQLDRKMS